MQYKDAMKKQLEEKFKLAEKEIKKFKSQDPLNGCGKYMEMADIALKFLPYWFERWLMSYNWCRVCICQDFASFNLFREAMGWSEDKFYKLAEPFYIFWELQNDSK